MSTCDRQSPDVSTEGCEDPQITVALAALMSGLSAPASSEHYPEPWAGIIARVGALSLGQRLDALGRELERLPGFDVYPFLDRVFEADPRRPMANPPTPIQFPIPTTIVDQNCETETPPFETVTLAEVLAMKQVSIDWCVEGLIPAGGVAILGGPPSQGKSWLLMDLALAVISGKHWLGRFPTKRGRVLYIDEESPPGLLPYRIRKLVNGLGDHEFPEDDLRFMMWKGLCLARPESLGRLRQTLRVARPILVIIDSLIRVHGSEENSASEMAKVFAEIKRLIMEFGCAFIFADHQKKPGMGSVSQDLMLRGTTEKVAFVDTLLSLTKKDGSLVVEHSKSRFALPVPSFVIAIEDQSLDKTVVNVVGNAEEIRQQAREDQAHDLVDGLLADGSWRSRKELTAAARKSGTPVKTVDEHLKFLLGQGKVERADRKPESGRGHKTAYYRKEPVANHVSDFQSIIGKEIGNVNESLNLGLGGEGAAP